MSDDMIGELERLKALRDAGDLDEAEFQAAKSRLLGTGPEASKPDERGRSTGSSVTTLFLLLVLLGVGYWGWAHVRGSLGGENVDLATAGLLRTPVQLHDAIENVSASSWQALPVHLPYAGTLHVNVTVRRGNQLEIWLTDPDSIANKKSGRGEVRHHPQFHARKARELKQAHRMAQGTYYLVLEDNTLGLLSAGTSDVEVKVRLEP